MDVSCEMRQWRAKMTNNISSACVTEYTALNDAECAQKADGDSVISIQAALLLSQVVCSPDLTYTRTLEMLTNSALFFIRRMMV